MSFVQPKIFFTNTKEQLQVLQAFREKHPEVQEVNTLEGQLVELTIIRYPALKNADHTDIEKQRLQEFGPVDGYEGVWVYMPWRNTLMNTLAPADHEALRTARNRNLITAEEQQAFGNAVVCVAGLSVGSHAAVSLVMQGGPQELRIADPDIIDGSNLNRIRTGFHNVGKKKTHVVAEELYEMNPFLSLSIGEEGITEETIESFVLSPTPVSVIVDEMDDITMKIRLREVARAHGIPVVSAADNGDGVLLDVERYDMNPTQELFDGRAKGISGAQFEQASQAEKGDIITKLIGVEDVTQKMQASVAEVGKTLASWPQLGGAAQMAGVAVAYAVRMLVTGGPIQDGRSKISLEDIISGNMV